MIDKDWLAGLKVGDPVVIHWTTAEPQTSPGTVRRLLVREIEVTENAVARKTFKFRRSDGRRWPKNAYIYGLWRIEKP